MLISAEPLLLVEEPLSNLSSLSSDVDTVGVLAKMGSTVHNSAICKNEIKSYQNTWKSGVGTYIVIFQVLLNIVLAFDFCHLRQSLFEFFILMFQNLNSLLHDQ